MKHFVLFLIYTWSAATYALILFGWNYFFCADEDCTFHPVVLHLVRIMTLLAIGAFLFSSSMLMNVCYGVMTGIGTIDRLKKKATNTMNQSDEEPIALIDVRDRICTPASWRFSFIVFDLMTLLFPADTDIWNRSMVHMAIPSRPNLRRLRPSHGFHHATTVGP